MEGVVMDQKEINNISNYFSAMLSGLCGASRHKVSGCGHQTHAYSVCSLGPPAIHSLYPVANPGFFP